jgi:hypothetical protein
MGLDPPFLCGERVPDRHQHRLGFLRFDHRKLFRRSRHYWGRKSGVRNA